MIFTVCSSIEIRNDASGFAQLRNCTVIEGHLAILLINYLPPNEDMSLRFPNLIEITDYLFLYRVNGLRTLRYMFPNLVVIRGQNLFHSYALVAFEMMHLEELGLINLMTLVRGAVRLEKNPQLCYVNTIDWSLIMKSSIEGNFILENRPEGECVNVCPVMTSGQDRCLIRDVPVYGSSASLRRPTCWNGEQCQFGKSDVCICMIFMILGGVGLKCKAIPEIWLTLCTASVELSVSLWLW
jgi:insulin receptor